MIVRGFLFLFLPVLVLANPDWLFKIKNEDKFIIIGYGIGKSLSNAKQAAISDITNTISVSVESSVNITNKDINGDVSSDSSINLQTKSKAVLSGVSYIKVENNNGMWYVAAKYDNSPIEIKLKKLLPKNLNDEQQNSYLKHTQLIKVLNNYNGKNINYEIVRKDNLWQLKYKDILIPLSRDEFYKLFTIYGNKELSISPNKKVYIENDEMYFNVSHNKNSYISILYVEHNGKVGVLLSNYKSNGSFSYPDKKSGELFKVANPYGKTIKEMYIAIQSKSKVDLHEFESVSDSLLDETNYNFDKLISKLDSLDFSTYEIKIRKD